MDRTNHIFNQAVQITSDYLGPAAERFIARQVAFHLHKDPQQLTAGDIPQLAEWIKVSIAILTEDREMVEEFTDRIMNLAGKRHVR